MLAHGDFRINEHGKRTSIRAMAKINLLTDPKTPHSGEHRITIACRIPP
jgi:hypothetical protein